MTSLADIADYTYGADISKAESKGERKLKATGAGLGAYGGAVMGQNAGQRRAFHGEMKRGDVVAFHRKTGSRAKNWNDNWGNYQY